MLKKKLPLLLMLITMAGAATATLGNLFNNQHFVAWRMAAGFAGFLIICGYVRGLPTLF